MLGKILIFVIIAAVAIVAIETIPQFAITADRIELPPAPIASIDTSTVPLVGPTPGQSAASSPEENVLPVPLPPSTSSPKKILLPPILLPPPIVVPPPTPTPSPPPAGGPTPTPPPATELNPLPPVIATDPRSIVGILCHFNTTFTSDGNLIASGEVRARGSGVIFDAKGHVLTNKHVIQPPDEEVAATVNGIATNVTAHYERIRCEAGQIPAGITLPTADVIRQFNPLIRIPVLAYQLTLSYIPSSAGMTAAEADAADFAVLQITGLTADAPLFGISSFPAVFPYAQLTEGGMYVRNGDQVLTYGFPGDVTEAQGNFFQTMDMTGSVGTFSRFEFGDSYYANIPVLAYTNMEITGGRSGSPLFWRGYVIGLTTFYIEGNKTNSGSVASDAIIKSLRAAGFEL
jgi:hypothetical protein